MPFVHSYLATINVDVDTHCKLTNYLKFVSDRASGVSRLCASFVFERFSDLKSVW